MNLELTNSLENFSNRSPHLHGGEPMIPSQEFLSEEMSHKQRVVAIGDGAHRVCVLTILIIQDLGVAIDFVLSRGDGLLNSAKNFDDRASVVLIEGGGMLQDRVIDNRGFGYAHHVGVVCDIDCITEGRILEKFIEDLPKGGELFFLRESGLENFLGKKNPDVKYTEVYKLGEKKISGGEQCVLLDDGQKFFCNEYTTPHVLGLSSALLKYFGFSHADYLEALGRVVKRFL